MQNQDYQKDTFVGYVNAPQTTINFSLTEQELNDLAKFLVANQKDASKPSRVYCTLKSGMSKAGKNYQFISVYDKSAGNDGQSYKKTAAPAPVTQGDDLPF
tara:strand:+ start:1600 stop:1902 length:303 start_codon:yes stop_codon:yes gene_type:complete